jgi:hypothetical protein
MSGDISRRLQDLLRKRECEVLKTCATGKSERQSRAAVIGVHDYDDVSWQLHALYTPFIHRYGVTLPITELEIPSSEKS